MSARTLAHFLCCLPSPPLLTYKAEHGSTDPSYIVTKVEQTSSQGRQGHCEVKPGEDWARNGAKDREKSAVGFALGEGLLGHLPSPAFGLRGQAVRLLRRGCFLMQRAFQDIFSLNLTLKTCLEHYPP